VLDIEKTIGACLGLVKRLIKHGPQFFCIHPKIFSEWGKSRVIAAIAREIRKVAIVRDNMPIPGCNEYDEIENPSHPAFRISMTSRCMKYIWKTKPDINASGLSR